MDCWGWSSTPILSSQQFSPNVLLIGWVPLLSFPRTKSVQYAGQRSDIECVSFCVCLCMAGWVCLGTRMCMRMREQYLSYFVWLAGGHACVLMHVCVCNVRACVYKTGECMGTCVSRSYVWVQMQTKWRLGGRETRCEEREVGRGEDKPFNSSSPSLSVH